MGGGQEAAPLLGGVRNVRRRALLAGLVAASVGCATIALVVSGRRSGAGWGGLGLEGGQGRVVLSHSCCSGEDSSCCYAGTEPWVDGAKVVDISPECKQSSLQTPPLLTSPLPALASFITCVNFSNIPTLIPSPSFDSRHARRQVRGLVPGRRASARGCIPGGQQGHGHQLRALGCEDW
jgi:hypothetical protein